jgi:hypothetical protein
MHHNEIMERIESTVYRDNLFDKLFIWLFSHKMAQAVGKRTKLKGYEGLVDLSKQIMLGRNAHEQQAVVAVILKSLVPAPVLAIVRASFSPTRLVCELNAWFATKLFEWLVGPCEVKEVEIFGNKGELIKQKSGVHIKKCRYLESSNCVGMCINMCKLPTQDFFTRDFGIPLTMVPDFEDYSCEMVFGQIPPPLEEEAVYYQPCLRDRCPTAQAQAESCPKVRES